MLICDSQVIMSDRVLRGLDPNVLPLRVSESNFKSDISGSPFGQENTRTSSIVKKEEAVTNLRQWLVQEELVMNANVRTVLDDFSHLYCW